MSVDVAATSDTFTGEQRGLATHDHFAVLDGLRGTAAFCVFLVHSFNREWAPNGFLGVDFFFLLSGFVIAYSYRRRLADGAMTLGAFARRRFVRLYPMVLAGSLFGLAVCLLHNHTNPDKAYGHGAMAVWTALSLTMLPYFHANPFNNAVFPLNTVLWSLFFELVANLVYAICARWMTKPVLAAIALVGLILTIAGGQINGGTIATFWTGFPRVAFGFFAGALIYELKAEGRLPGVSLGLLPLSIVLLAVTFFPYEVSGIGFLPVALLFCALLALAANAQARGRTAALCTFLGAISYPMYLLHRPLLYLVTGIGAKFVPTEGAPYVVIVIVAMILATIASYVTVRLYETPARALLGRRLLGRSSAGTLAR